MRAYDHMFHNGYNMVVLLGNVDIDNDDIYIRHNNRYNHAHKRC